MRKPTILILAIAATAIVAITLTSVMATVPGGSFHFSGALSVRSGARWECKVVNPAPQPLPAFLQLVDMWGNPTQSIGPVQVPPGGFITLSQTAFGTSMRYCRGNYPSVMRGELSAVDATRQATASSMLLPPNQPPS